MQELNPLEWAVRPFTRYAQFSGRAPRAEYWWFYLVTVVIGVPLKLLDSAVSAHGALSAVLQLALLIPWLAVSVRRLHDINRSGKWLFVPVAAFAIAGAMMGLMNRGTMSGRTDGEFTSLIVVAVVSLLAFIALLAATVLPGTKGPNDYGPDPYSENSLEEVFA